MVKILRREIKVRFPGNPGREFRNSLDYGRPGFPLENLNGAVPPRTPTNGNKF